MRKHHMYVCMLPNKKKKTKEKKKRTERKESRTNTDCFALRGLCVDEDVYVYVYVIVCDSI